jgi:hypothetical protein
MAPISNFDKVKIVTLFQNGNSYGRISEIVAIPKRLPVTSYKNGDKNKLTGMLNVKSEVTTQLLSVSEMTFRGRQVFYRISFCILFIPVVY